MATATAATAAPPSPALPRPHARPAAEPHRTILARAAERDRIDAFVDHEGAGCLVLVGEAGIGKTTLWEHGVRRARRSGLVTLVTRASPDDKGAHLQGLLDLFEPHHLPDGGSVAGVLAPGTPAVERCRLVLEQLRSLTRHGRVLLAVDDLPWLDDVTLRALRFALRRLVDEPVALLATARTWSAHAPAVPLPDCGRPLDLLEVRGLDDASVRRLARRARPGLSTVAAAEIADLAHGNPLLALELARAGGASARAAHGSALAALTAKLAELGPPTLRLARRLAVAGPSALSALAETGAPADLDEAVRGGLRGEVFTLDDDFVLRFTHPLLATAALRGMDAWDRREVHAALAAAAPTEEARVLHSARAAVEPDAVLAQQVEETAARLARQGAHRAAADLLGDSERLTPPAHEAARARRTLARMMQCATAGDLHTALGLADDLLERLEPGPLRAEVATGRVVLDFEHAEEFLRAGLQAVPADGATPRTELVRGRLLGLLGWFLAIHQGRLVEGLAHAEQALAIGESLGDDQLVAQASSAVSTASLMLGRRRDGLIRTATRIGGDVVRSELALWPGVLLGRQQLWDGRLREARANFDAMHRSAVAGGAEFQRSYRLYDLSLAAIAAGDLDEASVLVDDGSEAAHACGDERAVSWLAYPAGLLAALRGDRDTTSAAVDRLTWWTEHVGDRPRAAMAAHLDAMLAAAGRDWCAGLDALRLAERVLDGMSLRHPGVVPVLPLALQLASLAELTDEVDRLAAKLSRQTAGLDAPGCEAHVLVATGLQRLAHGDDAGLELLDSGHARLDLLGFRLDAARAACVGAAAAARRGRRSRGLALAESAVAGLANRAVRGWDAFATELRERLAGGTDGALTSTEAQVAALVAAGRRNREVAAQLYVSESTVEAHLTRIYRKLGLRNRAELARCPELAVAG